MLQRCVLAILFDIYNTKYRMTFVHSSVCEPPIFNLLTNIDAARHAM